MEGLIQFKGLANTFPGLSKYIFLKVILSQELSYNNLKETVVTLSKSAIVFDQHYRSSRFKLFFFSALASSELPFIPENKYKFSTIKHKVNTLC